MLGFKDIYVSKTSKRHKKYSHGRMARLNNRKIGIPRGPFRGIQWPIGLLLSEPFNCIVAKLLLNDN